MEDLDAQLRSIKKYADEHSLEITIYQDIGHNSSTIEDRPGLLKLLKCKMYDIIIPGVDVLTTNCRDAEDLYMKLGRDNIKILNPSLLDGSAYNHATFIVFATQADHRCRTEYID